MIFITGNKNRHFFSHFSICFFIMLCFNVRQAVCQQSSRPNIVFILADDLGYGDVKCFNPEGKIPTPNLDKLADEGMKFTDAHASSSVCTPSRYSILTGRYPWRSRLQESVLYGYSSPLIEKSRLTVASFLKANGYYTACLGKWHLGMDWPVKDKPSNDTAHFLKPSGSPFIHTGWEVDYSKAIGNGPNSLGFDYFYGISASLDMPPFAFIENNHTVGLPTVTKTWVRPGPAVKDFEAEDVLPAIVEKAKGIITAKPNKNPFFIYLALPSPHTPIVPDKNFKGKGPVTEYGDYVMETDWAVGEVMKTLDSMGLAGNTMVIFTSDNGFAPYVLKNFNVEALGHMPSYIFRGYKSDIWDGGHRVPTIARWPGHVQAGSVCNELVSLTDFTATVAGILQKKLPGNAAEDSYNVLPYLLGKQKKAIRTDVVYASIDGNFSIKKGKWKLVFCPGSGGWELPKNKEAFQKGMPLVQLYDMAADVSEKTNVEAAHPEIVKQLTQLMKSYLKNGRSTPGVPLKNAVPVDIWKKAYQLPDTKNIIDLNAQ
jgi:arylsulfatase A